MLWIFLCIIIDSEFSSNVLIITIIIIVTISDELNQHRYELKNIEDNLTATRNAIKNKVNAFGEYTEQVLKEITMEKRFKKKPIGPIGKIECYDCIFLTLLKYSLKLCSTSKLQQF